MKKTRILSVMAVFAVTSAMAFGQFKIYNSELLKKDRGCERDAAADYGFRGIDAQYSV